MLTFILEGMILWQNMPAVLNNILKLIGKCSSLDSLKQTHAQVIIHGLCWNNLAAVKLVAFSCQILGHVGYACSIFNFLSSSANVYLWTAMITCYSHQNSELTSEAVLTYRSMLDHGVSPNNFTLSTVLKSCSSLKSAVEGKQVHAHSAKLGFCSSVYVLTALVDMYAKFDCVEEARHLFNSTPERNTVTCNAMMSCHVKARDIEAARGIFEQMSWRDTISFATMITGYTSSGNMAAARELFDQMRTKEVTCWNALIVGYCHGGEWDQSIKLLKEMLRNSAKPDCVTMAVLMSSCGHLGVLRIGTQLHGFLHKTILNLHANNSLVNMYAKCGSINEAYSVFLGMPEKDLVSYNAMITGLSNHGHVNEAIDLFQKALERGDRPDAVTFLAILSTCSQNGLVDLCLRYFELMRSHGINPSADHYACIVDIFSRTGLIETAYQLVKAMPVEPHAGVWGALLNACTSYCHVRIGRIAAKELFRVEPENPGNYVLLSNTYARACKWNDVKETRGLMRRNAVAKAAGCSWIELGNEVYRFVMGDEENPVFEEIFEILRKLSLHLMLSDDTS